MLRGALVLGLFGLIGCGFRPSVESLQEAGTGAESQTPMDAHTGSDAKVWLDAKVWKDAPVFVCDSSACTTVGGTCSGDTCVIHSTTATPLACPSGQRCQFECDNSSACRNGIDCASSLSCEINCNANNSCQTSVVDCAGGCTVYCRGNNTCDNAMYTCGNNAEQCDLECCGNSTCSGNSASTGTLTVNTVNASGVCP